MTNWKLFSVAVAGGVFLAGLLIGQVVVTPPAPPPAPSAADSATVADWVMVSQEVAGSGGTEGQVHAALFLYNQRSGKVYRVYTDCGDQGADGCAVPLPVLDEGIHSTVVPRPQSDDGGLRSR